MYLIEWKMLICMYIRKVLFYSLKGHFGMPVKNKIQNRTYFSSCLCLKLYRSAVNEDVLHANMYTI